MVYSSVLAAHKVLGSSGFWTSTNACGHYMRVCGSRKARLPCWSLQPAGVTPGWIWEIYCTQVRKHASKGFSMPWKPGQTSPEVQHRGISVPMKRTCKYPPNFYFLIKCFRVRKGQMKQVRWFFGICPRTMIKYALCYSNSATEQNLRSSICAMGRRLESYFGNQLDILGMRNGRLLD